MENKQLDFYRHDECCSLKCASRNYIKNRKSEAMDSFAILDSMVPSAESHSGSGSEHAEDANR